MHITIYRSRMGSESTKFHWPLLNRACKYFFLLHILLSFWPRKLSWDSRSQLGSYFKPGTIPNRQSALVLAEFNGMDAGQSVLVIPKHIYFTAVEKACVRPAHHLLIKQPCNAEALSLTGSLTHFWCANNNSNSLYSQVVAQDNLSYGITYHTEYITFYIDKSNPIITILR